MEKLTVAEIVCATKGILVNGEGKNYISSVSIDGRQAEPDSVFFAIKGENTDGHLYLAQAVSAGAKAVVVHEDVAALPGIDIIKVDDTTEAMLNLAAYYKKRFQIPFIAITGSSGKTTTKDLVASVLAQQFNTLKTQGNFNNETGMPLTLFRLNSTHEIAVIELGMSRFGEIDNMAKRLQPDVAAITNIGYSHIGELKTQENIFKAKSEVLQYLAEGQTAIVNGDDRHLNTLSSDKYSIIKVGIENGEVRAENIVQSAAGVCFEAAGELYTFRLSGRHNVLNCLFAITIGKLYSLSQKQIQAGLDCFAPSDNRMDIRECGGITLINDVYNSNPDAVKGALDVLCNAAGKSRKVAVLADMLEMGPYAESLHYAVGEYAGKSGVDCLLTVGEDAVHMQRGAEENGVKQTHYFNNNDELAEGLIDLIKKGDFVLLKGSRGMHLEEVVEKLKKHLEQGE